jgi:predicted nucleotidyltransferase
MAIMKLKNIEVSMDKISAICKQWHISQLSLFGSVLRDDFAPDSDIDILVEFEPGFTPGFFKLHQIQEELSSIFNNRSIDLVTPNFVNHRIRNHVLANAEVCYVQTR